MKHLDNGQKPQSGTLKQRQIKNSALYMLPVFIGNIIPLITLPVFTRILTPEDYGAWALAQVWGVFASGLANLGLIISYERNYFQYSKDKQKSAQLIFSSLLFVTLNCFVIGLFTYICRSFLATKIIGSSVYGNVLFFTFVASCIPSLTQYYLLFFRNSEQAVSFTGYTVAVSLIQFILSLFFVVYVRTGVIGLVYSQLFSTFIIFFILSWKFINNLGFSFNRAVLWESLKISMPMTPRIFLGVIDIQINKYMIGLLSSLGGTGIYRIGEQISGLVFRYMTQLEHVFIPHTYKQMFESSENGKNAIGKYLTPFAYISIFPALLISVFSEEIIFILTPEAYHGTISVVIVLSMYYACSFVGKISGTQLIYCKKTYVTSILSFFSVGITVGLGVPFIMKWGAIGAAWATFTSGLLYRGAAFVWAQKSYRVNWEYRRMTTIFLILFGSSLLVLIMRELVVPYPVRIFVKIILTSIYVYYGVVIRVVTMENFLLVKNMIFKIIPKSSSVA